MPRGSHFLLLRQKKVTKEKATPTFALIQDLKRKRRAVRNSLRSDNGPLRRRFHSKSRGRIHGDPAKPIFDRCAISIRATITPHLDYAGIPFGAIGHHTPQMHVTNRFLTHEERGHIAARLDAMLTRKRRRSRVITLVVVALVIAIFLFVFWITREPSSSAIMAGIGAYFSFMVWGQPTRTAADMQKRRVISPN